MVEKNKRKEKMKERRVWFDMNLGTVTHKDKKHPHRRDRKKEDRKIIKEII